MYRRYTNYYKDHHGVMFEKHLSEEQKQHLGKINKGKPTPKTKEKIMACMASFQQMQEKYTNIQRMGFCK